MRQFTGIVSLSVFSVLVLLLMPPPNVVQGANILCLLGVPLPSHYIWNNALMTTLALRGHNLTVLTVEKDISRENLTFIRMDNVYESLVNYSTSYGEINYKKHNTFFSIKEHYKFHNFISKRFMQSDGIKQLVNYSRDFKFDLIVHDATLGQALLGFVEYFGNPPLISVSPGGVPLHLHALTGSPVVPAYMPHFTTLYDNDMTMMDRIKNLLYHWFDWFYRRNVFIVNETIRAKSVFGKKLPVFVERIECKTAIVLINADFSLDYVQNLPPNVVTVGGLQVKRNEIFDPVIQRFLDASENAHYVVINFGINPHDEIQAIHKIQTLFDAILMFPDYDFIWKYDLSYDLKIPKNLLIVSWLPQLALLSHPRAALFITNGGLMSVQEAVWFGVPVLGMPFFWDQHRNVRRLRVAGAAEEISVQDLNVEELCEKIKLLLYDNSYKNAMKNLSEQFRIQPEHPMDRAVFWVEKVIKLKSFEHLQSPGLNFYVYEIYYLDVVGIGLLILLVQLLLHRLFKWRRMREELRKETQLASTPTTTATDENNELTVAEIKKDQ